MSRVSGREWGAPVPGRGPLRHIGRQGGVEPQCRLPLCCPQSQVQLLDVMYAKAERSQDLLTARAKRRTCA